MHLKQWPTYQRTVLWVFLMSIGFGLALLASSLFFNKPCLSSTDRVTLFVGLLAAAVVLWQGKLIADQIVLSTILELYRDWNSQEMLDKRQNAWTKDGEGPNADSIEDALEFLEKVSTIAKNRFVTSQLVWDTFGWYIGRYYFYCKNVIQDLRRKWTDRIDPTLYQDLEWFYPRLLELEVRQRNEKKAPGTELLTAEDIETEYNQTRRKFIWSEMGDG